LACSAQWCARWLTGSAAWRAVNLERVRRRGDLAGFCRHPWRPNSRRPGAVVVIDAVFDVSDVRIHSMDVRTCPRCSLRLTHRPNRLRQMHLARFQKTQPSSQSLMATSVSESLNAFVESCHAATSLSQLIYVECNWMN